ncbi:sigma-54-dependent transcriptional regulator [Sphaerobacter thermophilus]|uniref:Two component, sigma54 specific, transcriptional regulator, Fis family n=1 Tax=Sphaerobacter thermophilus (strain ATCC 49802 / DSM 20745 / KCCM 41009 / NCIMB 13125 / S 6022) TaxID=479434 RepID=D1C2T4_SPHTD|nr:sigma-54 dependent transcriptional regulator [Sphaerobacter thermophilus]ACZ38551.1 two component, sigma54 specific, transcriptional regulator, Fis family [Sphaerobacter thermophilus DSM 20745]
MERILIADDDAGIRQLLRDFLEDEGYDVMEAETSAEVLSAVSSDGNAPALVLMDVRMPDKSGIDVLRDLSETYGNQLPFIIMTAYGSSSIAIDAMQLGAYDYITKPFDLDDVLLTIRRYFEHQTLKQQVQGLRTQFRDTDPNDYIIGNSAPMQEVYKTIGRVARSDATVLITGETGTGKELVATVLHRNSSYAGGPLVKVNCAALPETLLESELFGHEKGAFTGALNQRKGRFEMAHKGTIFLDEIGEMSLSTQKKLLRVLQEREFERVGGTVSVKVDTRVIAATNKNLAQEVRENRFREDLYYRLNVITIYLPPLRERLDDIPMLVEHFLHKHRYTAGSGPAKITPGAMRMLQEYDWPGNVRELENLIERAVVLAQGTVITEDHITFSSADQRNFVDIAARVRRGATITEVQQEVEKLMLIEALKQVEGDRVAAASLLGLDIGEFQQKLIDYGIPGEVTSMAPY